jgi:RnfABCDGE-type electron transport complex D subunit
MWSVVIALIPALLAGVYFFGFYSLYLVLASALSAVIFEKPFIKNKATFGDGSAFLAGTLLGLTLPPTVPWWLPILGGFLAVVVGKHLFGGLGSNIFNPALVARAILLLSYPALMIDWISPVDGVSTATPLQLGADSFSYTELIVGNIPGSIGETSVIALIIGGVYLYLRDYIDLRIPLSFVAGAAGGAIIYGQDPIFTIFSGAVIFAAIYMATDMVTSPVAKWAKVVYGLLGGFLTIFIRRYTPYPEGITFAILIINGASYFLDNAFEGPHFGEVELVKKKIAHFSAIFLAAVLILLAGLTLIDDENPYPGTLTYSHLQSAVPTAESFEIVERDNNDILFAARKDDEILQELIYISRNGFEAPIEILISLGTEENIENIKIIKESESPTLGARVKEDDFLSQFEAFTLADAGQIMNQTDMISGATFSSQTVSRAVQAGLQLVIAENDSGLQDGVYEGRAEGAQGDILLEITVESGDIVGLEILEEQETEHLAQPAYEELEAQLLREQTADLDVISGATYTSEAFMEAVQQAIDTATSNSETEFDIEAGEYTGKAQGHIGEIELEVVVEAGEIIEINVVSQNETAGLGDTAIEKVTTAIVENQSLEVDTVSGATNSSEAAIKAVRNALDSKDSTSESETDGPKDTTPETTDADSSATWEEDNTDESSGSTEESEDSETAETVEDTANNENSSEKAELEIELEDGVYKGSAAGHIEEIELEVVVEAGEIIEINVVSQNETAGLGDTAIEKVTTAIVENQSLEVDTVSGATNSSEAAIKAVRNALDSKESTSESETDSSKDTTSETTDADSSATWEEESEEESDVEAETTGETAEGGSNG